MLQKFTIQRREEEHENQKRLLRKKKSPQLIDPAQPCKNKPLSLVHTDDSPVTSALAFGHSGSQGWGSKLDCCLLEDRSSPNAAQLRAGGAKLHSSAAGGEKNSNRLKHFRLIATGIKTQQIFLGQPHSDEVKVGSNNSGSLIVQFLVSHFALCHRLMRSFDSSWVHHVTASVDKWTLSGLSG